MAEDTQGTKNEVEETTPSEKVEEPTQPKEEPTGYKNEEEYNKALQTGVSKGLESIQRQLDLRRTETDAAKSETVKEKAERESVSLELQDLQGELDTITSAIEDGDIKSGVLSKRALGEDRRKILKLKAEAEQKLYDAEVKVWRVNMDAKAKKLVEETGIGINEFIGCDTEADMEVKALRYSIANPKKTKDEPKEKTEKEEEKKAPEFAGGGDGGKGGGGIPTDMGQFRKWVANLSQREFEKRSTEINEMMREGKIK